MTKKHVTIWVGVLVSIGALILAFWDMEFVSLKNHLVETDWRMAALLLLVYWAHFLVRAKRWQILLAPVKSIGFGKAFGPMMIGFFGNNVLPAHMGELVRMFVGARQFRMTNAQVLATLVVERVMDAAAVAVLFGIGLAVTPVATEGLAWVGYAIAVTAVAGITVVAIYLRYGHLGRGWVARLAGRMPEHMGVWLVRNLEAFGEGLGATRDVLQLLKMSAQSIFLWLIVAVSIHFSLLAVGLALPFSASLLLLGATVFAVSLPAAPGYFGTFQLAYVLALKPHHIDSETAVAASIVLHLLTYISVTAVGVVLLGRLGLNWHRLKHEVEDIEEAGVATILGQPEDQSSATPKSDNTHR